MPYNIRKQLLDRKSTGPRPEVHIPAWQGRRTGRGFTQRELRALGIVVTGGQLRKVGEGRYEVLSQSGPGHHEVRGLGGNWSCDCQDFQKRRDMCKHTAAVIFALRLQDILKANLSVTVVGPGFGPTLSPPRLMV